MKSNHTFAKNKHDTNEKLPEKQSKKQTAAYQALRECFEFIEIIGSVVGWKLDYGWKSNPRHWFTVSYLTFTWSQFFYSQYKYFENGELMKVFEVFAVYGVALSVIS